jgi:DNA polymerase-3 subunit delta
VIPVIASFATKIRQLARVHSDRGIQPAVLGVSPWVLNKIRSQAAAWSDDGLTRALNLVAEADVAAKGGGDRQPEYLVEKLVLLVANRGELR